MQRVDIVAILPLKCFTSLSRGLCPFVNIQVGNYLTPPCVYINIPLAFVIKIILYPLYQRVLKIKPQILGIKTILESKHNSSSISLFYSKASLDVFC